MPRKSSKPVKPRVKKSNGKKPQRDVEKQRLIDGAKACIKAVDGKASFLLGNRAAAHHYGVDYEGERLNYHLGKMGKISDRLLGKLGVKSKTELILEKVNRKGFMENMGGVP